MKGRYVPLSVTFAHGSTGARLIEEFGAKGLLVWVCLIAACKRSLVQGQYEHVSDAETWATFGLSQDPPDFIFEEFLRTTGRLRKTTQRRSGRILYVSLSSWEEWNKIDKRGLDSARKSRKREESRPDTTRTQSGHEADTHRTDIERERERERERRKPPVVPQKEQELWDAVLEACGPVKTGAEHSKRLSNIHDLVEIGATPAEIIRRARNLSIMWPKIPVTSNSLVNNWSKAERAPTPVDDTPPEVREMINERLRKVGLQ